VGHSSLVGEILRSLCRWLTDALPRSPFGPAMVANGHVRRIWKGHGESRRREARSALIWLTLAERRRRQRMRDGRTPEAERTLYELWGMEPLAQAAVEAGEIDYAERCALALLRVPEVAAIATRNSVIRDDRSREYEAHVILGKVALSRGDVDAAERHLLEASGVVAPSSAHMTSDPTPILPRDAGGRQIEGGGRLSRRLPGVLPSGSCADRQMADGHPQRSTT
jgi:hypothetical protein